MHAAQPAAEVDEDWNLFYEVSFRIFLIIAFKIESRPFRGPSIVSANGKLWKGHEEGSNRQRCRMVTFQKKI